MYALESLNLNDETVMTPLDSLQKDNFRPAIGAYLKSQYGFEGSNYCLLPDGGYQAILWIPYTHDMRAVAALPILRLVQRALGGGRRVYVQGPMLLWISVDLDDFTLITSYDNTRLRGTSLVDALLMAQEILEELVPKVQREGGR